MSDAGLDVDTLGTLMDMEIEKSLEPEFFEFSTAAKSEAMVSEEMIDAAQAFEFACRIAPHEFVKKNLSKFSVGQDGVLKNIEDGDASDDNIVTNILEVMRGLRGGYGYLYYMEHEGAGVGTWDGEWDVLVRDNSVDPKIARPLLTEMSEWVTTFTKVEYQNLQTEIENTAYKILRIGIFPTNIRTDNR
jgi:hypothetical protein